MAKKVDEVQIMELPPEPNVMFIGANHDTSAKNVKPGEEGFVPGEPIKKFNDGMTTVRMPPEQMKPFYHKEAGRIVRLWPKLYKAYVSKGDQF